MRYAIYSRDWWGCSTSKGQVRARLYLACIEYGSVCLVKPRSIAFFEAILVSARYVDRTVAVGVGSYDGEVGQGRREVAGKFHADRR